LILIFCDIDVILSGEMSTIYKIADKVGLSPSTVARALRGTGYCSAKNRALVQKAAREMDYTPTHAARMLKSKRSNKILFCIPDIYNPFYFGMIKGASDVLEKHGYFLVLCHTKHSIEEELRILQALRERYGDGMILVSFNFTRRNIDAINACGMPVVLTNKYSSRGGADRFDYVFVDTYKGIGLATEHLIGLGHRRIAYVGGDSTEQTGAERLAGYRDAMRTARLDVREGMVISSDYTREGGWKAGQRLLRLRNAPTAVVAANDLMAVGCMQACESLGVPIPSRLSVVGMDNTDIATIISPHLSSVAMRQEDIGANAATLLMERIREGRDYRKTVRLEPELVARASTAAPPRRQK
jgi:LacI family transcriptional regulator